MRSDMCIVCGLVLWLAWSVTGVLAGEEWLMSLEEIAASLTHYKEMAQGSIQPSEMSLEALAAGVEHYNSLIRSGRGTVSYFSPRSDKRIGTPKAIFTFDGRKMCSDMLEGIQAGRNKIYNGEVLVCIHRRYNRRTKEYVTSISKGDLNMINTSLDPRSWYQAHAKFYLENPLEKRLRDPRARFVGREQVDEKLCYVVDESGSQKEPRLLWICPEEGFRVLKTCNFTWGRDRRVAAHRRIRYKVHEFKGESIWFPQRVEYIDLTVDEQHLAKDPLPEGGPNILTVYDDFEINLDVSSYFEPRFAPGTLVFDVASRRELPVEQILPDFVDR